MHYEYAAAPPPPLLSDLYPSDSEPELLRILLFCKCDLRAAGQSDFGENLKPDFAPGIILLSNLIVHGQK